MQGAQLAAARVRTREDGTLATVARARTPRRPRGGGGGGRPWVPSAAVVRRRSEGKCNATGYDGDGFLLATTLPYL
jgi:hypothetical protein